MGFGRTVSELDRDRAMKALNQFLRPEFINRVDEIICFIHLTEENFRGIARIMLGELTDALRRRDWSLSGMTSWWSMSQPSPIR